MMQLNLRNVCLFAACAVAVAGCAFVEPCGSCVLAKNLVERVLEL